jgi:hypothetical protein
LRRDFFLTLHVYAVYLSSVAVRQAAVLHVCLSGARPSLSLLL